MCRQQDDLRQRYGLPEPDQQHRGLADARVLAQLFPHLQAEAGLFDLVAATLLTPARGGAIAGSFKDIKLQGAFLVFYQQCLLQVWIDVYFCKCTLYCTSGLQMSMSAAGQ